MIPVIPVLGGMALGAGLAVLVDALSARKKSMGQYFFAATPSSGGGGGAFGGGTGLGPITGPAPSGMEDGGEAPGEIISVPPIVHDGGGVPIDGGSFFGISAPFYFWPMNFRPYGYWNGFRRPVRLVCRKKEVEGEEVFVCERAYPTRPVAWGPPAGWM